MGRVDHTVAAIPGHRALTGQARRYRATARGRTRPRSPPPMPAIQSLPPDRFPNTVSAADVLMGGDPDERFEFGLDVIVRGIETFARPIEAIDAAAAKPARGAAG